MLQFYLAISKEGFFLAALMAKCYDNKNLLRFSLQDKHRTKTFTVLKHRRVKE